MRNLETYKRKRREARGDVTTSRKDYAPLVMRIVVENTSLRDHMEILKVLKNLGFKLVLQKHSKKSSCSVSKFLVCYDMTYLPEELIEKVVIRKPQSTLVKLTEVLKDTTNIIKEVTWLPQPTL